MNNFVFDENDVTRCTNGCTNCAYLHCELEYSGINDEICLNINENSSFYTNGTNMCSAVESGNLLMSQIDLNNN